MPPERRKARCARITAYKSFASNRALTGAPTRRSAAVGRRGSFLLGRDHHDHLAAFQSREALDDHLVHEVGLEALRHRQAELGVGHFTAAEADRDLDLVAFGDEATQVADLDLVVALVRRGTELELLDLLLLRLLARRVRLLLLLELELAEVHDPAHGRL